MIVVDANVAVKWYLPERGSEAALELMTGPNLLFGPDLIRLEVLAAITRRFRNGESTREECRKRCESWVGHLHEGVVSLVPEAAILKEALGLAMQIKHPLQDCMYLAAAMQLDAPMITADRILQGRSEKIYKHVSLLAGCENN